MNTTPERTETPRTDAHLKECLSDNRFRIEHMADFARQLETELNQANAQNEALRGALKPFAAIAPHVTRFGKVPPEQVFLWKPSSNTEELPGITAAHIQAAASAFNSTPPAKA